MAREFRKLDQAHLDEAVMMEMEAYPADGYSEADKQRVRKWMAKVMDGELPDRGYYGILEDGVLLANMCLYTFDLNCRGHMIRAGGIGSVATGLLHRKRGAARDLLQAGLRHYRNSGVSMVTLYPFRPGFYRKMGFGHGAQVHRYRIDPINFPNRPGSGQLHRYTGTAEERRALLDCYERSGPSHQWHDFPPESFHGRRVFRRTVSGGVSA